MAREPLREITNLPINSEISKTQDVVQLSGNSNVVQKRPQPVRSNQGNPTINFSEYQQRLLEEIKKNPQVMKLFKIIFNDYPILVNKEYRLSSPHATHRQKDQGRKVTMERLKLEAFIEEQICIISGIDIKSIIDNSMNRDGVQELSTETQENSDDEILSQMIEKETEEFIKSQDEKIESKEVTKKKATKKKVTKKTAKK